MSTYFAHSENSAGAKHALVQYLKSVADRLPEVSRALFEESRTIGVRGRADRAREGPAGARGARPGPRRRPPRYTSKGDPQESVRYGEPAVEKAPTPADKVWAQTSLAYAWCRAGEPAKAAAVLSELLSLYQATRFIGNEVWCRIYLGEAQWRCGNYGMARETLQGGLQLAEQLGMKFFVGCAHRFLGEVFAGEQLGAEATAHFETSIEILERIRSENELALAYAGYGRLHVRQGDRGRAQEYLTRALEIFERLGTPREPDSVRQELDDWRQRT